MKTSKGYRFGLNLKQAVVFAILMENGEGVVSKSPNYIIEKLASLEYNDEPEGLLDLGNLAKYREWENMWIKKFEKKEEDKGPELPGVK